MCHDYPYVQVWRNTSIYNIYVNVPVDYVNKYTLHVCVCVLLRVPSFYTKYVHVTHNLYRSNSGFTPRNIVLDVL